MELTQTQPLSIVILQDWQRLFAKADKEKVKAKAEKDEYIEIQWEIVSTVRGNIRTIRDATDIEYYEFFVLDKLPQAVMEKMHISIGRLHESKTNVSLTSLLSHQKRLEDEENFKRWWLTPLEKENRRKQVIRMNKIMVDKWIMTSWDVERIVNKMLNPEPEKNRTL